jgi:hypothetical protein
MLFPRNAARLQTGGHSRAFAEVWERAHAFNERLPFRIRVDLGAVGESVGEMAAFEMPPHELLDRTDFQIASGCLTV